MKSLHFFTSILLLNNVPALVGAQVQEPISHELKPISSRPTPTEVHCLLWFARVSKLQQMPSIVRMLSNKDKAVYDKRLQYKDYPKEVMRLQDNYADLFIAHAKKNNITLEYDTDILKSAMLKATRRYPNNIEELIDELTADSDTKSHAQKPISDTFTFTELYCLLWFARVSKLQQMPPIVHMLSNKDRAVYDKRLQYKDYPKEVMQLQDNYADLFIAHAKKNNITLEYDADILKCAMLKATRRYPNNIEELIDELTKNSLIN